MSKESQQFMNLIGDNKIDSLDSKAISHLKKEILEIDETEEEKKSLSFMFNQYKENFLETITKKIKSVEVADIERVVPKKISEK